jgi:hypothetical protein
MFRRDEIKCVWIRSVLIVGVSRRISTTLPLLQSILFSILLRCCAAKAIPCEYHLLRSVLKRIEANPKMQLHIHSAFCEIRTPPPPRFWLAHALFLNRRARVTRKWHTSTSGSDVRLRECKLCIFRPTVLGRYGRFVSAELLFSYMLISIGNLGLKGFVNLDVLYWHNRLVIRWQPPPRAVVHESCTLDKNNKLRLHTVRRTCRSGRTNICT